jgi:hypothetical protein
LQRIQPKPAIFPTNRRLKELNSLSHASFASLPDHCSFETNDFALGQAFHRRGTPNAIDHCIKQIHIEWQNICDKQIVDLIYQLDVKMGLEREARNFKSIHII